MILIADHDEYRVDFGVAEKIAVIGIVAAFFCGELFVKAAEHFGIAVADRDEFELSGRAVAEDHAGAQRKIASDESRLDFHVHVSCLLEFRAGIRVRFCRRIFPFQSR